MGANIKLANAMNATAKTMADMNKIMKPEQVAADMRAFGQASMKLDMTDEMSEYDSEKSADCMAQNNQCLSKICGSG
jgi:hypothetical protein